MRLVGGARDRFRKQKRGDEHEERGRRRNLTRNSIDWPPGIVGEGICTRAHTERQERAEIASYILHISTQLRGSRKQQKDKKRKRWSALMGCALSVLVCFPFVSLRSIFMYISFSPKPRFISYTKGGAGRPAPMLLPVTSFHFIHLLKSVKSQKQHPSISPY